MVESELLQHCGTLCAAQQLVGGLVRDMTSNDMAAAGIRNGKTMQVIKSKKR